MSFMSLRAAFTFSARRLAALWLVFLAATVQAQAPDETWQRDLWQTVQARKLLLDDPQLGPLNLGVKVTERIAILWGPVPSRELAQRAEQRLQSMFELTEVRNRLSVEADDDEASPPPASPHLAPDERPPLDQSAPRRRIVEPAVGVALAGIVTPDDSFTARSSPLTQGGSAPAGHGLTTLHMPFLGSIALPR